MSTTQRKANGKPVIKKNPVKDRHLAAVITAEDKALAAENDKYACLIVCSIQRSMPDAKNVRADKNTISFSLERDDTRYWFHTPEELVKDVIKPFDTIGAEAVPDDYKYTLTNPYASAPIQHRTTEQRRKNRNNTRITSKRLRDSRANANASRTLGRFLKESSE